MAFEFLPYPTHSEAQALASLATTSSTEPFSGIQYFHELLRVLRDPTCSNFLFTSDPIELQHLVHPQLPHFAVTNDMYEVNVEPNTSAQDSLSDQWNSRHFMFPAYSSDGKTFGFLISKDTYVPGSAWGIHAGTVESLSVSRFVKHDEEGYTVFVAHYEDFNAYRLEYAKLITNTQQVRFLVAVDANVFQRLRQRGSLFVKDMFASLLVMQMSREHRRCPACLHSAHECFCAAPIVKPRHPFDYEAFGRCAMNRGGVFEGRTAMTLFAGGVKIRSGILGSRFVSRPKYDFDVVEGLRRLAITKHLGGESARHSNIFADAVNNMRQAQLKSGSNSSTETVLGSSFIDEGGAASQLVNFAIEPCGVNYLLPPVREEEENFETTGMNLNPSVINAVLGPSAELGTVGGPLGVTHEDIVGVQSVDEINQGDSFGSHNSTPTDAGEVARDKSGSVGIDDAETAKKNGGASADDQIRRLKAELRKERNRACAQRSNMKKKAMMDALKNDIRTTREKADLLRSQEMLLRKQNIFLKKQVADRFASEGQD